MNSELNMGLLSTMEALPKAVCGGMFILSASHPVREMPLLPVSHSYPNCAWILSLVFCWNLATVSISSGGVYSLIMNVS